MINARKIFRKVTSKISDFSEEQLDGLTTIMEYFRGNKVDFKKNSWLRENFKNNSYEDLEGICKIVSNKEIYDNDLSLNPGRYVGFSIKVDENFDYKKRLNEIKNDLNKASKEGQEILSNLKIFK